MHYLRDATDWMAAPTGKAITEHYFTSKAYRFGFNTQEKTPEISPDTYTAELWQYENIKNDQYPLFCNIAFSNFGNLDNAL
ncbi:MAG: hypothetical protein JJT94_16595 [Bernardetiaceae bacterium]|nr:hypothetical protein [Bernardetiaceae bacterium]